MVNFLTHKNILLGVTGSIAAYKSADLVRRFRECGANVRVVMTENAKRFITPLTMQALSGYPVRELLFDPEAEAAMGHIELARWADVIVIAPASADTMARLVQGTSDDLLTTLCLATPAPIALAPAMNQNMWRKEPTQENLKKLLKKGIYIFGPNAGDQACGDVGPGRMLEPMQILHHTNQLFSTGLLAGRHVLVTAGPTHEAIDPVRFISNGSSGKMGYALAQAAREAGAVVTLISGPVNLAQPEGFDFISVVSAQEMYDAVHQRIATCDIFMGVAAVGDYRAQQIAAQKIQKTASTMTLTLERNPDIVASVGHLADKPFVVGFAAETENLISNAQAKRERKNMDMIVANLVKPGIGMNTDDNAVTVITKNQQINFAQTSKLKLSHQLIHLISTEYNKLGIIHDRSTKLKVAN